MRGSLDSKAGEYLDAGDHPRACGAHDLELASPVKILGSSPRMRGSPPDFRIAFARVGIIPAHAGLTIRVDLIRTAAWDHPRACGAHQG